MTHVTGPLCGRYNGKFRFSYNGRFRFSYNGTLHKWCHCFASWLLLLLLLLQLLNLRYSCIRYAWYDCYTTTFVSWQYCSARVFYVAAFASFFCSLIFQVNFAVRAVKAATAATSLLPAQLVWFEYRPAGRSSCDA